MCMPDQLAENNKGKTYEALVARHLYFLKVDESHESYWRACEGPVTNFKPHPQKETLFFSQIPYDYLRHFSLVCLFGSSQNFPLRVSTPFIIALFIAITACSLLCYFQVDKRQLS